MMDRLDANKDGNVEKSEFMASQAEKFAKLDAAGRGSIAKADFAEAMEQAAKARRAERVERMFGRLDANSDGVVTREEYLAQGEKRFSRLDRDGNGTLTPADRSGRASGSPADKSNN